MKRTTCQKLAAIGFFVFGAFEILGMLMLFVPQEYLPAQLEAQPVFWAWMSGIYGISRLIAGYAIHANKKWGMVFGLMLCLTTMIVAPTIVPFGIVDLVLTVGITLCLLYAYYGEEKIFSA
ncbi:MAG: hypothetical protein N2049_09645 [Anaerolineales bacterium]|nr:hypothetical protein [Anaerolineales bacterium]MCX7609465.1 hypothetical protein [Anaerolineales bacterium]MDW8227886.1 hypothetical protein [Anaerolineales bacterium]MDW8279453.1 hypothetical protein [Anaerolineales bacterium]